MATQAFEDVYPNLVCTESEIVKMLTNNADRTPRRKIFDNHWIAEGNQGQVGSCFPAGTLVRMGDGSQKPIEKVQLLDEVLTAEGRVRKVMRTMVRPHVGSVLRVCVWGNRHIRCTAEHPFLTKTGYKPAESLQKSDWIAIPKFLPQKVESIVPSEYIKVTEKSVKRKSMAHAGSVVNYHIPGKSPSQVVRKPLPELIVLNEQFGMLCGLFIAEGSITSGKIVFTFNKNEEHTLAAEVVRIFSEEFGVKCNVVCNRGQKQVCEVKAYGTGWCRLFESLFGSGSAVKRLHPDIASGPKDFLEAILKGWQLGDGLGDPERCGGVTVSHSLAMNMYDVANALGHNPTVETLNVKINPKHKIKHRHMRYIVAWPSHGQSHPKLDRFQSDESVMWRKFAKCEPEPFSGWVYNLEVEDDHSYVVEGVGVHNCNGWMTSSIESKLRWLRGIQDGLVLSGSYVYSLINGGNDNGSALQDDIGAMTQFGSCPASMCPANNWHRNQTKQFDSEAAKHKQLNWMPVKTLEGFFSAIYFGALGGSCVDVNNAFANWNGVGICPTGSGIGNHAVHVDDVVIYKGSLATDSPNNWGLGWGDRGRGLFTADTYARTFQNHQFYVAFSTAEADPV